MNKYLFIFLAAACMACGGNEKSNETAVDVEEPATDIAQEPAQTEEQMAGRELIKASDCTACHMDEQKIVGPAYVEVAQKYEENDTTITYLANKIIAGGSGNWGTVPMTPHPQLSQEDAEEMVKYILSLN